MSESLKELSDRATPGPWSVSGSRRRYDEASCVMVDTPSCGALLALATSDGKATLEALADARLLVTLVNAYRSGQLHDATALVDAEARGRRQGLEWRPINEAPYGQEVRIQAGEMTFLAMLVKDGSMLEDETPCDQWQATREGEHPECWSDGACWASNADDCASLQPTGWVPSLATAPTEPQKPETAMLAAECKVYRGLVERFAVVADAAEAETARLRAAFRVNLLRYAPEITHADIDAMLSSQEKTDV